MSSSAIIAIAVATVIGLHAVGTAVSDIAAFIREDGSQPRWLRRTMAALDALLHFTVP